MLGLDRPPLAAREFTVESQTPSTPPTDPNRRVIKRYSNRKLYDTNTSRYVALDDIAGMVRRGEEVAVTDNETGADLTAVTLAQIILEDERRRSGVGSVAGCTAARAAVRRAAIATAGSMAPFRGG